MPIPGALLLLFAEAMLAPARLPIVATAERIALPTPPGSVALTVRPFEKQLVLRTKGNPRPLQAKIVAATSRLCPRTEVGRNQVTLACADRRLDGALVEDKGKLFLEIYELRGVPWKGEENRISVSYENTVSKFKDVCTVNTPLARGECAFKSGNHATAAVEFRRALTAEGKRLAALRLGDLSLINQDPVSAAGWYQTAGRTGAIGRLAAGRLCELSGGCFEKSRRLLLEAGFMPEPMHTEMLLRQARVEAYLDEIPKAMEHLKLAIKANHGGCEDSTLLFCRQLLLKIFALPGQDGIVEATEAYLALPNRQEGPLAEVLLTAVVDKIASLGAKHFADDLLSASGRALKNQAKPLTAEALLQSAEQYLEDLDRTRARVVIEYAETRLGRAKMKGPRWNAVLAQVQEGARSPIEVARVNVMAGEVTRDLTTAYTALARANSALVEAAVVKAETALPTQPAKEKAP